MHNQHLPSSGGHAEHNERLVQHIEVELPLIDLLQDQTLLNGLLDAGFAWDAALKLINMREHLYENAEIRQRVADDSRMHFVKWLYEHDELNEF